MIVKRYNFLGINFFEKERLFETIAQFDFDSIHCEDIGLFILSKHPKLKFSNTSSFDKSFNWYWIAKRTIRLALLNLINNKSIEIIETENINKFLFNSIKRNVRDYHLNISDINQDQDILTVLMFRAINEVNKMEHPSLFYYVKAIIDEILATGSYSNPAKSFSVLLLKKYAKKFPWLEISEQKKWLGIIKNSDVKVTEIYIPRIAMQHEALSELDLKLYYENSQYKRFCNDLESALNNDFSRREPSSD